MPAVDAAVEGAPTVSAATAGTCPVVAALPCAPLTRAAEIAAVAGSAARCAGAVAAPIADRSAWGTAPRTRLVGEDEDARRCDACSKRSLHDAPEETSARDATADGRCDSDIQVSHSAPFLARRRRLASSGGALAEVAIAGRAPANDRGVPARLRHLWPLSVRPPRSHGSRDSQAHATSLALPSHRGTYTPPTSVAGLRTETGTPGSRCSLGRISVAVP